VPARIDPRPRTLPHLARGVAVLALGLGALTACGGNSDAGDAAATTTTSSAAETTTGATESSAASGGASQTQALTATEDNFSISLDKDTLTAGTYEITVVNKGSATHDLAVEEDGTTEEQTDSIAPGGSTTLTVDLDPGEYVFYCTIGNHRAMGMEITVQVT
jgi:plastocyanin